MDNKNYCKIYYLKNKEYLKKKSIINYYKNREKRIVQMREWKRKMYDTSPEFREKRKQESKERYRRKIAYYSLRNTLQAKTIKQKARMHLQYMVKIGKLIKPFKCDICKITCKTEGHHYDGYENPLKVIWLCRICHCKLHRKYS